MQKKQTKKTTWVFQSFSNSLVCFFYFIFFIMSCSGHIYLLGLLLVSGHKNENLSLYIAVMYVYTLHTLFTDIYVMHVPAVRKHRNKRAMLSSEFYLINKDNTAPFLKGLLFGTCQQLM